MKNRTSAAIKGVITTRCAKVAIFSIPLASLGVTVAGPTAIASAGTNGQQISACDYTTTYAAVKLKGYNQNGKLENSPLASINHEGGESCHSFTGYWWKSQVTLTWYLENSGKTKITYCTVPVKQKESDWVVATSEGVCDTTP